MVSEDSDFDKAQRVVANKILNRLAETKGGSVFTAISGVETLLSDYLWCEKCTNSDSKRVCDDCVMFAREELAQLIPSTKKRKDETGSEKYWRIKEESEGKAIKKAKREARKMVKKKEIKPITAYFGKK